MTGERTTGPLAGRTVLVTRARHQAAGLAEPLLALGAEVLVAPVIETIDPEDWAPVDQAIAQLGSYDWLVLTSANAVDRFLDRMAARGVPVTELASVRIAAVGSATAERLGAHGLSADLVPDDFRAEGLVEAFEQAGAGEGWHVLLPRAAAAREILPDSLRELGVHVDVVPVYRTVPATPDPRIIARLRDGEVDAITFTSPSTVRHFIAWVTAAGLDAVHVLSTAACVSIGPVTTGALESRGCTNVVEAGESTAQDMVRSIRSHFSGSEGGP